MTRIQIEKIVILLNSLTGTYEHYCIVIVRGRKAVAVQVYQQTTRDFSLPETMAEEEAIENLRDKIAYHNEQAQTGEEFLTKIHSHPYALA